MIGCFGGTEGWACSMSWLVMVVLFFIAAIARRQFGDLANINFSMIGGIAVGELAFIIFLYVFEGLKIPFIIGIAGVFVGGFIGSIWDQSGGEGGFE